MTDIMTREEQDYAILLLIATYGKTAQVDVAIEEMSELIKALLKLRRLSFSQTTLEVCDELADVTLMLRQLELIYGIDANDTEMRISKKLRRQLERLSNQEEGTTND